MRCQRSSAERPATSELAAMAPALIIGLRGRPLPGSRLISLKASPVGSTPMRASTSVLPRSSRASPYTNGFEIDWIVNAQRASPTS